MNTSLGRCRKATAIRLPQFGTGQFDPLYPDIFQCLITIYSFRTFGGGEQPSAVSLKIHCSPPFVNFFPELSSDKVQLSPEEKVILQGWGVFAVSEEQADLRPVEIGRNNGLVAQVLQGLHAGDRVIAYPAAELADGAR